jgi:pilus assembly protein Flp/PilA
LAQSQYFNNKEKQPMKNFNSAMYSFIKDESGQDLIEYALVASLIGLGCVAAMTTLKGSIATTFGSIGTAITSATT